MADPFNPPSRSRVNADLTRDLAAVLLVLVGFAGLTLAGFVTDWRLGIAILSAGALGVGARLAYRR